MSTTDWRPIETAPKTGDDYIAIPILGFIPTEHHGPQGSDDRIRIVWWEPGLKHWQDDRETKGGVKPTHWMPLPAPPGSGARSAIDAMIAERLNQHADNLSLWESGYLNPTEPDPEERRLTMERLKAAIFELRYLSYAIHGQLPTTPEEVSAAEAYLKAHPVALPESLRDPMAILRQAEGPEPS